MYVTLDNRQPQGTSPLRSMDYRDARASMGRPATPVPTPSQTRHSGASSSKHIFVRLQPHKNVSNAGLVLPLNQVALPALPPGTSSFSQQHLQQREAAEHSTTTQPAQGLSARSIAQRARREREAALRQANLRQDSGQNNPGMLYL